jgi:hypothetical protein
MDVARQSEGMSRPRRMRPAMRICLTAVAVVALAALGGALVLTLRSPLTRRDGSVPVRPMASEVSPAAAQYTLSSLDSASDLAYNKLLGINNLGHIAGYYGSGRAGQRSRGYVVRPPYSQARYQPISFPGSAQTQLTGLNDQGVQVGFWSVPATAGPVGGTVGGDLGGYLDNGRFHAVSFPARDGARPPANQLLGVNDHDVAVGFYTDDRGFDHGYQYAIATRRFTAVTVPGASSVVAAAINNPGSVAGYFTDRAGVTEGFVLGPTGRLSVLSVPRATMTQALGLNDSGEVVGDYQLGTGSRAARHGFTWTERHGFRTVDGPDGAVSTTINGINNAGDLVGYYTDAAGRTDGLLATPVR